MTAHSCGGHFFASAGRLHVSIVFTLGVEAFWGAAAARRREQKIERRGRWKSYTIIEQEEKPEGTAERRKA